MSEAFYYLLGLVCGFCLIAMADDAIVHHCGTDLCATYKDHVYQMREVQP